MRQHENIGNRRSVDPCPDNHRQLNCCQFSTTASEGFPIEQFISEGPIKALTVAILLRTARLYVSGFHPHAL